MSEINRFLVEHGLLIAKNPCISPDFCLDWPALAARLLAGAAVTRHPHSEVDTGFGRFSLVEDEAGDHAWLLSPGSDRLGTAALSDGILLPNGALAFPATWTNLLRMKNLLLELDPESTVFPSATGSLQHSSLGVGARFTTLHWPAV